MNKATERISTTIPRTSKQWLREMSRKAGEPMGRIIERGLYAELDKMRKAKGKAT